MQWQISPPLRVGPHPCRPPLAFCAANRIDRGNRTPSSSRLLVGCARSSRHSVPLRGKPNKRAASTQCTHKSGGSAGHTVLLSRSATPHARLEHGGVGSDLGLKRWYDESFSPRVRKPVENVEKWRETLLTRDHGFGILDGLWKCLSAGQGGTLFDNRYDVPESVRNHPGFRARMG